MCVLVFSDEANCYPPHNLYSPGRGSLPLTVGAQSFPANASQSAVHSQRRMNGRCGDIRQERQVDVELQVERNERKRLLPFDVSIKMLLLITYCMCGRSFLVCLCPRQGSARTMPMLPMLKRGIRSCKRCNFCQWQDFEAACKGLADFPNGFVLCVKSFP